MIDWLSTMQQTFEYYIVDPGTWKDIRRVDNVISSTIKRDLTAETLGSAIINISESLGECYVRIYLIAIQNRVKYKYPLGTFLIQTPSYNFDGKFKSVTMDAYTPLLELKENLPPLGYSIMREENILDMAHRLVQEQVRAPVVKTETSDKLYTDFVANVDDTWITFIYDLLSNAKYSLYLDEMGQILFVPEQDTASLQPVWTYDDSNSSILYPSLDIDHDLYGIPNVVEVIYSNGTDYYYGTAVNNNVNSPISVPSRGRRITHRITNPSFPGNPSKEQIQAYAEQQLKALSSLEYTVTYTHGYCPVRIGDCVRLNYSRAGLSGIKAKVTSQSIDCVPGCPVTETAVFTADLWR